MAAADYVLCNKCVTKLVYNPDSCAIAYCESCYRSLLTEIDRLQTKAVQAEAFGDRNADCLEADARELEGVANKLLREKTDENKRLWEALERLKPYGHDYCEDMHIHSHNGCMVCEIRDTLGQRDTPKEATDADKENS